MKIIIKTPVDQTNSPCEGIFYNNFTSEQLDVEDVHKPWCHKDYAMTYTCSNNLYSLNIIPRAFCVAEQIYLKR